MKRMRGRGAYTVETPRLGGVVVYQEPLGSNLPREPLIAFSTAEELTDWLLAWLNGIDRTKEAPE